MFCFVLLIPCGESSDLEKNVKLYWQWLYFGKFFFKSSSVMSILFHYFPCRIFSCSTQNESGREVFETMTFKTNSIFKCVICGFCRMWASQHCVDKTLMICDSLQFREQRKRWIWEKVSTLMWWKVPQRDYFSNKFKNAPLDFSKMTGSYVKVTRSPKWEQ